MYCKEVAFKGGGEGRVHLLERGGGLIGRRALNGIITVT